MLKNVTLNPNQATEQLTVDIIQDAIIEGNELFAVQIIVPEETQQFGVSRGSPYVSAITIIDDDRKLLLIESSFKLDVFIYFQL